ncbi:transposase domain-containing protein [Burkholderia cepacia]|uniref:transposase domain-containing protein n=1 Tax=Burkholderia cepacia TaxID=292 RepID=UPI003EE3336A
MKTAAQIWLTMREGCALLSINRTALNRRILGGEYVTEIVTANGGAQYRIRLDSLPPVAQARYYAQVMGLSSGNDAPPPTGLDVDVVWRKFEDASDRLKSRAERNLVAVLAWFEALAAGKSRMAAYADIQRDHGIGRMALNRWLKEIDGQPREHWLALVCPDYRIDNAKKAEWTPAAWEFFLRAAMTPGAKVRTAWRRTQEAGASLDWSIPSYDTAKRDYLRVPEDVRTLLKSGGTALKALSPTQRRDYTSLSLHELWCLDGRRIDLMVRDDDGSLGVKGRVLRPYVLGILEVRTRVVLGYAISASLDADVVRQAFLSAMTRTNRIIPRGMLMDNGMENAAKEISGGAPWRRRGKVKDDEIIGLFPMLGVNITWAMTAHGQSKPIERAFGTIKDRTEPRLEFQGAYCGHKPDARPEEWDARKAVPLSQFRKVFADEVDAYHRTPHRGQGMEKRSPMQVYGELSREGSTVARRITEAQARLCAYSAVPVTLNRRDHSFTILGNRYWSEKLAALPGGSGYYARYNPDDLTETAYLYKGEKLVAEAAMTTLTPFLDKRAAKEHAKRRADYIKSVKNQAKALHALQADPADWLGTEADPVTGEILPIPQVIEIVNARADAMPHPDSAKAQEDAEIQRLVDEMEETLAAERAPKRAFGGA